MRAIRVILIAIYCALLFGGAAVSLFLPAREYSDQENRELTQKPEFSGKKFLRGKYQKKYETYLSDQFFGRERWVDMAARMQSALGRRDINGVWLGKEGYLVEKQEQSDFDREQVKENTEYLASFLNDAEKKYGKGHVSALLVPSKAEALPDYLPDHVTAPSWHRDTIEKLCRKLSDPEMVFSPEDILRKHQGEYIYYRSDHHWTTLGAYYAWAAWAEETGLAVARPLEHYHREEAFTDFYGTTYNKAHIRVPADRVELFHTEEETVEITLDDGSRSDSMYFRQAATEGFNRYDVFFSGNTFQVEIDTAGKSGRELLVIKDSFANCFVPFLTEDYDRIIMVDYRYGKTPIGRIMEEQGKITDVLVLFNTEKFMQSTGLDKLADTEGMSSTMEEFNMEDFLE